MPDHLTIEQSVPFEDLSVNSAQDKLKRSYNMSRIRGKDTKPEMILLPYERSDKSSGAKISLEPWF